jgi:hypothetical protein
LGCGKVALPGTAGATAGTTAADSIFVNIAGADCEKSSEISFTTVYVVAIDD